MTEFYRGGSVCIHTTPLTPGCHCAPVTINHVLQSLALFEREGTNHTPHYPGLVTLKRWCRPGTPQPVAVWPERGRRARARTGEKNRGGSVTMSVLTTAFEGRVGDSATGKTKQLGVFLGKKTSAKLKKNPEYPELKTTNVLASSRLADPR